MAMRPLVGAGLVARMVSVPKEHVVFLKAILEASEGLGAVFAEPRGRRTGGGGDLIVAAPVSRAAELDELLADLEVELGALASEHGPPEMRTAETGVAPVAEAHAIL
jgi:hypothetical protein